MTTFPLSLCLCLLIWLPPFCWRWWWGSWSSIGRPSQFLFLLPTCPYPRHHAHNAILRMKYQNWALRSLKLCWGTLNSVFSTCMCTPSIQFTIMAPLPQSNTPSPASTHLPPLVLNPTPHSHLPHTLLRPKIVMSRSGPFRHMCRHHRVMLSCIAQDIKPTLVPKPGHPLWIGSYWCTCRGTNVQNVRVRFLRVCGYATESKSRVFIHNPLQYWISKEMGLRQGGCMFFPSSPY